MSVKYNDRAIGIFDSGLGGLTVFKSIRKLLPAENIIYFGDTARVPYGTKSKEAVIAFSKEIASWLLTKKIKLLVVACNTASSLALDEVRKISDVEVLGVIEPGVDEAFSLLGANPHESGRGRVLVIGTSATISSRAYSRALYKKDRRVFVEEKACPLFVPLAEEGWCSGIVARGAAGKYLGQMKKKRFDAVILGCTHYPLLKKTISSVLGPGVRVVDSAMAAARGARAKLEAGGLLRDTRLIKGKIRFVVSDAPQKFKKLAAKLLKIKTGHVTVKRF